MVILSFAYIVQRIFNRDKKTTRSYSRKVNLLNILIYTHWTIKTWLLFLTVTLANLRRFL